MNDLTSQKVLLADDHGIYLGGLKFHLDNSQQFEVVGQVSNGREVLEFLRGNEVDVVVLDVNMPELDGVSTLKQIRNQNRPMKVLMLTAYNDKKLYDQLLELGANGVLNKSDADQLLIEALETICNGASFRSKGVQPSATEAAKRDEFVRRLNITKRELEVLSLVAQEMTSKEIAEKLFISEETAKTHRKNLIKKLEVKGVAGLVKFAFKYNLA